MTEHTAPIDTPDGDAVERAAREALVDAYNPQSDEHADHLADVARPCCSRCRP
jgi:hypothetical protein